MASRTSKVPIRRPRESASTRKLFLLAVFLVAQTVFFSSAMFRVQTVEVTGTQRLSDSTVRAQAGLSLEGHLFSVPLRTVEERVRALHWVNEVAVRRYMPGRIQIRVRERVPALAVACASQVDVFPRGWFVISEDGMVLAPAGAKGDERLPRVLLPSPLLVGRRVAGDLVSTVEQTLAAVPPALATSVHELRADEQGQLYLTIDLLGRPVEVRLGASERSAYKFQVLQALSTRLTQEGRAVTYIDLRYTDPAVGYVLGQAQAAPQTERQQ